MDVLPVEPNPRGGLTSSWKISNEYMPICGKIRYVIHYHESSFAGIWERIMREELLDWSQSKIFLVYYYFRINNVFIADKGIGLITKRHDVLDTSNTRTETKVFC